MPTDMFGRDKDKVDVIETLPMVPLRDVVVFPHMMIPFVIGRPPNSGITMWGNTTTSRSGRSGYWMASDAES